MKVNEKNSMENIVKKYEMYLAFYKLLSFENINMGSKEEKIAFWQDLLYKNGFSNDYYFFIYSVLTGSVKSLVGYDYLYGMSEELRNDEEFKQMLIRLSGNNNLVNYINITEENISYNDSDQYNEKLILQNNLMKRL